MMYIEDQTFKRINFPKEPLAKAKYNNCIFRDCDFLSADLSEYGFEDCEFIGCNLSLLKTGQTAFRNVKFKDCKILGVHFEDCNDIGLSFSFENCQVNQCSFYQMHLKNTFFKNSQIHESDFAGSDLPGSVFADCDLLGSIFENTRLEKADFTTAINYTIDPETNKIRKAKFSITGLPGLLQRYDIVVE